MTLTPETFPTAAAAISVTAILLSLGLTPLVRALARATGAVARPKSDRWHSRPTAMLGGVSIFVSVVVATLAWVPLQRPVVYLLGAGTFLFALGLVDDFLHIRPYQKLIGQIIAAAALIHCGMTLPWTGSTLANMTLTLVWLVGVTNSVNMLDNMDGLAAGIAAIAAVFLVATFVWNGQWAEAVMLSGFAAVLAGFLVFNWNPASIFMGDCGSLFIGFFLAGSVLLSGTGSGRSRSLVAVLAVPVLVLCVPIFDTTFVTLMRKLAGRAASQGGRDHTSHRLVALGLSEKHAVWMLYALAIGAGLLAMFVRSIALDVNLLLIASFVVALTFLGIHLGRVRVYDEDDVAAAREKPLVAFLVELSYKRRVFEVLLDLVLISAAYYLAYVARFGRFSSSADWQLFLETVPVVVCVQIATFLAAGVYRGIWRYASVSDAIALARAVAVASLLSIMAIVFTFRFAGFSRLVFAADGVLLLLFVTSSRFAFRLLRRLFPAPNARSGRRVVIYGAGDGGELLLREIHNNPELPYAPVAFVDDDPAKRGRVIHGVEVCSADEPIVSICRRLSAGEVLVSTNRIPQDRLSRIVAECASANIAITRAWLTFQPLDPTEFGWVIPSSAVDGVAVMPPEASLIHPKGRITDH